LILCTKKLRWISIKLPNYLGIALHLHYSKIWKKVNLLKYLLSRAVRKIWDSFPFAIEFLVFNEWFNFSLRIIPVELYRSRAQLAIPHADYSFLLICHSAERLDLVELWRQLFCIKCDDNAMITILDFVNKICLTVESKAEIKIHTCD